MRSIPRLRAVVMIQPAGLGGRPVVGHRSSATTNASWTASSATSMSPKKRTRVATARPDSARKMRSMSAVSTAGTIRRRARPGTGAPRRGCAQATLPSAANFMAASRSGTSMIQKPPSCSLASANGPSVTRTSPPLRVDDGGGVGRLQPPAEHPDALLLELGVEVAGGGERLLHLFLGGVGVLALDVVDGEQVLGHGGPPWSGPASVPDTSYTNGMRARSTARRKILADVDRGPGHSFRR